jgi:hypothetical protein
MKRFMAVLFALVALAGLVMVHGTVHAQAGQPAADKQLICHVSDDSGAHIIEVARPAVPAHLANHGDCLINSEDRTLIGDPCNPTDANNDDVCDVQP